jgi:hypothetical protein
MPTKKKSSKRKTATKKRPARKSSGTKKSKTRRRGSMATSKVRKTAASVLAGAAAGAVRALIPPLEEAAGASEKMAKTKKGGKTTTR